MNRNSKFNLTVASKRSYLLFIIALFLLTGCAKDKADKNPEPVITTILSFEKNPAGTWQIGYSVNDTLVPEQFQLSSFADTSYIIGLWHPSIAEYYPYVGQNQTGSTQVDASNSWAAKAGEIVMEGSNTGQYSMLRFIAPVSGTYRITAVFEGIHFNLSSTDVHVLLNAQSLFDDIVDGYGGDTQFHPVEGSHPSASYEEIIFLNKDDVITFAVGYGLNKNHYNDTTGLLADIAIL